MNHIQAIPPMVEALRSILTSQDEEAVAIAFEVFDELAASEQYGGRFLSLTHSRAPSLSCARSLSPTQALTHTLSQYKCLHFSFYLCFTLLSSRTRASGVLAHHCQIGNQSPHSCTCALHARGTVQADITLWLV